MWHAESRTAQSLPLRLLNIGDDADRPQQHQKIYATHVKSSAGTAVTPRGSVCNKELHYTRQSCVAHIQRGWRGQSSKSYYEAARRGHHTLKTESLLGVCCRTTRQDAYYMLNQSCLRNINASTNIIYGGLVQYVNDALDEQTFVFLIPPLQGAERFLIVLFLRSPCMPWVLFFVAPRFCFSHPVCSTFLCLSHLSSFLQRVFPFC